PRVVPERGGPLGAGGGRGGGADADRRAPPPVPRGAEPPAGPGPALGPPGFQGRAPTVRVIPSPWARTTSTRCSSGPTWAPSQTTLRVRRPRTSAPSPTTDSPPPACRLARR